MCSAGHHFTGEFFNLLKCFFFLSRKYFSIALRQKIAHNYSWNFRQMSLNLLFSGRIIAAESLRKEVMPHPPIRLTGGM
jgi:hypothetical protein